MSTHLERKREACKKHYEKKKLLELALHFEHYCVEQCNITYQHPFYHWSVVPHEDLFACGYIHDYNTHRKKILEAHKQRNPIRDIGVDFIGKAPSHYVAGQAKLYKGKVPYTDSSTWLAKVSIMQNKSASNTGILCTVSGIVDETWEDMQLRKLTHLKLDRAEFEDWAKHKQKKTELLNEADMILRPYQQDCVKLAMQNKKTVLNLTCALGKTVIMGNIAAKKQPRCILAMAPIRSEVANLYERLPAFLPGYETFLLDSDGSTDLSSLLCKVQDCIDNDKNLIIFTTYKSATNIISEYIYGSSETNEEDEDDDYFFDDELASSEDDVTAEPADEDEVELEDEEYVEADACKEFLRSSMIIADEVHQIHPNRKQLVTLLNKSKEALYATATLPRRFQDTIAFDAKIDKYDFNFALQNKLVVDYQIMIPLKLQPCESLEDIYALDQDLPKTIHQKAACLWKGMLQTGSRRCIVYLADKNECREFMKSFEVIGESYHGRSTEVFRVNNDISANQRKEIFNSFEADAFDVFKIIVTCQCLNQAINLVKCDSTFICSLYHFTSEIVMFQRFMRASRVDPSNPSKKNTCFLWSNDEESSILDNCLHKLKKEMKDDCFNSKVKVYNQSYDVQEKHEVKEKMQEEEKTVEGCLVRWVSVEQKYKVYKQAFLEYANKYQKVPSVKTIYKNIKIGRLWDNMKYSKNFVLRETLCNESKYYKDDFERYLQDKKTAPSVEEIRTALLAYVKIYNKVPTYNTKYTLNSKTINIGSIWGHMKRGGNTKLREKICNESEIFKNDYQRFEKAKANVPSEEEKETALLEYAKAYNQVPTRNATYTINNKSFSLYNIWKSIEDGFNATLKEKILAKSQFYKDYYILRMKEKENAPTEEEKQTALLEYAKAYNKVPTKNAIFTINNKIIQVARIWDVMKSSQTTTLRETICNLSQIYKNDYERYIKRQNNAPTEEEKKIALLAYVKENKCVPVYNIVYKLNNKNISVGQIWRRIKVKDTDKLRDEICKESQLYLKAYETYLENKRIRNAKNKSLEHDQTEGDESE